MLGMGVFPESAVVTGEASSRASPLPQGFDVDTDFVNITDHCGSGLARDSGTSVAINFKAPRIYALTPARVNPLHNFTQHLQSFTATLVGPP
jgi:hypothetical protein